MLAEIVVSRDGQTLSDLVKHAYQAGMEGIKLLRKVFARLK
jgi:hypothetical protein